MSYLEVYNEKIHDLLVIRDDPNQRRMPVSKKKSKHLHCKYVNKAMLNIS